MNLKPSFVLLLLLALGHVSPAIADRRDRLAESFLNPPADARPWVYWFVMDGNLSREGITADFEAMQRVGVGGLIMMEVDVGIPKGQVRFRARNGGTIANLWPNRLIADSALPAEKRLTSTTWNPFQPDSPLLESGLLGPVKLLIHDNAL